MATVKDIQILLEREAMRGAGQAKVVERKENPKMLEHLCGINVHTTDRNKHDGWHG